MRQDQLHGHPRFSSSGRVDPAVQLMGLTGQLTQREGGAHLVAPTTKPHKLAGLRRASATMPWLFQQHCQARSSPLVTTSQLQRVAWRLHLHQHGRHRVSGVGVPSRAARQAAAAGFAGKGR